MVFSLQNSVGQLYFLSCSGPGVTQADVAALQCVANPPDCDQESIPVAAAVASYVAQLNERPTPTTDGVCIAL